MAKCLVCGDTLKVQGDTFCERCKGMGKLLEENDFGELEVHNCWRCKGRGYLIDGDPCPDRAKEGHL